ncbi:MAG: ROK family protein [Anaerolineae bacterium]
MIAGTKHADKVVRFLCENGTATIQSLGEMLELSESSVSRLIKNMIDARLVQVSDSQARGPGRPVQVFRLNDSLAYAVGVELGKTATRWTLINAIGHILKQGEYPTRLPVTNAEFLDQLEHVVSLALDESNVPRDRISCIGVALHGFIDHESASCVYCATMPGPRNIPVGPWMENRFGLPTIVLEEGRSVAFIESRLGSMRDIPNFITVTIGKSIGTGIVVNHQLYIGETSMAGHLAHISVDTTAPRCVCGARGCVEMVASCQAIIDSVADSLERNALTSITLDDRPLDMETIAKAGEEGDQLCYQALNRAGELIGIGIGTLSKVLNINRIVVYGTLPTMSTVFVDAVRRSAKLNVLPLVDPIISISSLPAHAVPQGAAFFALNRHLAQKATELVQPAGSGS